MQPLISVIIPVYNHAYTLKRSLESIFNQTHRPLEVIIVNDGSTDNFSDVIKTVIPSPVPEQSSVQGKLDEGSIHFKIITQLNSGAPAARNNGFANSKGKYVIFWDADTFAHPQMLQKMFDALQKHPQAAYAYSRFKFGWKRIKSEPFDADKLKKLNYIDVTSLIRRSALSSPFFQEGAGGVADGPFDTSLKRFQDWDLWLTMLEQGKTGVFVPEVLYEKVVGDREGISTWLPSFMYQLPWKTKQVKKYESAKEIIVKKHRL
jgi:glycosyltransferase involved in cell wall biosynthesis